MFPDPLYQNQSTVTFVRLEKERHLGYLLIVKFTLPFSFGYEAIQLDIRAKLFRFRRRIFKIPKPSQETMSAKQIRCLSKNLKKRIFLKRTDLQKCERLCHRQSGKQMSLTSIDSRNLVARSRFIEEAQSPLPGVPLNTHHVDVFVAEEHQRRQSGLPAHTPTGDTPIQMSHKRSED